MALAEAMAIPVATSLNGKETIPGNHPLNLGVVGSYSVWCANQIVSEADLVIFVGSHTGDQVTNGWTVPAPGAPVVQLDLEPMELGRSYPGAALMCGDAKAGLRLLARALEGKPPKQAWAETARQRVAAWREKMEPQRASDQSPIQVERLCREISLFLPDNGVLVADTGWSGIWTGTMVELKPSGPEIPARRRFPGLGLPRRPGSQVRRAGAHRGLLHGRRRLLLPPG